MDKDIPTIRITKPREPFIVTRKLLYRLFERNEEVYIRAQGHRVPKMIKFLNTMKGRIDIRSFKTGLTKTRGYPDHAQFGILQALVAKKERGIYEIGFCCSREYKRKDIVKVVDDVSPIIYVLQDFQEELVNDDFEKDYNVIHSRSFEDMMILVRKDVPEIIEEARSIEKIPLLDDLFKKENGTKAQIVELDLSTGSRLRILNVNFPRRNMIGGIQKVMEYVTRSETATIVFGNFQIPLFSSSEYRDETGNDPTDWNSYYLLHRNKLFYSFRNRNVLSNPSPEDFEKPMSHVLLFPRRGISPRSFQKFRAIAIKGTRESKYVSMLFKYLFP